MSILINKETKILCQGITGTQASFHIKRSLDYGTSVVAGVTPGKGGTTHIGLPVFDKVKEAVKATGANASIMFVPARFVKGAVTEAVNAGLDLIVCITDGVPNKDMLEIKNVLKDKKTKFIGPNTPGVIAPGIGRLGIFPEDIHNKGKIGVVSRSSTLTYEAVIEINNAGMGQSAVVGLGDDMLIGEDFVEILKMFHEDENTEAIVLIGQLGGNFEEAGAAYYKTLPDKKPVIAFVAGDASGNRIGYAGDIITNGHITIQDKKDAMIEAGMIVVNSINSIHKELKKLFPKK